MVGTRDTVGNSERNSVGGLRNTMKMPHVAELSMSLPHRAAKTKVLCICFCVLLCFCSVHPAIPCSVLFPTPKMNDKEIQIEAETRYDTSHAR